MTLSSLGWDDFFASAFHPFSAAGFVPARVALEHKHAYALLSTQGEFAAECTGRLLHEARTRSDLPAVGDWVAMRPRPNEARADIHALLPRRTKFSRQAPGDAGGEQIIAANVDTVFLVTALDDNYNLRRIERALTLAWESGAHPVVILNKSDLHADPAGARAAVAALAPAVPVVVLSAIHSSGLDALAPWVTPGRTLAFIGSSGVGKSTLINRLLGSERQVTRSLSAAVGKGRHATTQRALMLAPSGALVMDTPGMRELQLWEVAEETLDTTFADVAALAGSCRFGDCTHRTEPGCAIQTALEQGSLDPARWQSYQKLQREQAYAARRADPRLARATRAAWRKIHQDQRAHRRMTGDD